MKRNFSFENSFLKLYVYIINLLIILEHLKEKQEFEKTLLNSKQQNETLHEKISKLNVKCEEFDVRFNFSF